MSIDDIHYICNILCEIPALLTEFTEFLPLNCRLRLSDSFEKSHIVYITQDDKVAMRVASVDLVDADIGRRVNSANRRAMVSLNNAIRQSELQEAARIFAGSEAERQLLFQQLREAEASWSQFTKLVPKSQLHDYDQESLRRTARLMIELGAFSNRVPEPIRVDALQVDDKDWVIGALNGIQMGQLEGKQVVVKMLREISEVAEGLAYLHGIRIVHSALRGSNVLVCEDYSIKLCGFDSRLFYLDSLYNSFAGEHPLFPEPIPRWQPPEVFSRIRRLPDDNVPTFMLDPFERCKRRLTYAGDVPQYEGVPPDDYSGRHLVPRALKLGLRPIRPDTLKSDELWSLLERCWRKQPNDRPSIEEVRQELAPLQAPPIS
ncbi:hypothetical protein EIP86_003559 [Pleurotus ostreatoroseus]|nr:hypothetical protein EIP86_003559 [Pleurotus ostreatoroseus]